MRPILREWDGALRAVLPAYERLVPEAEARGSVLRPPASEAKIAEAERRLGVTLPPSYRSFLAISDGADAGVQGADRLKRWYGEYRNALCRAEELRPLSDFIDWLVPMWLEALSDWRDRQDEPSAGVPTQVFDFEPGLRALALTKPQQDGTVALVPFPEEWQVWEFWHSEVIAYASFAEWLLHLTRHARTRLAERQARVRAASADSRSASEAAALAESGDPRALDVACRALGDDQLSEDAKQPFVVLLIQLGDPKAIPALRAAYAHAGEPGLRTMLLWALDSCGDRWVVDELQRLAASASETEAAAAASMLERRDQIVRW